MFDELGLVQDERIEPEGRHPRKRNLRKCHTESQVRQCSDSPKKNCPARDGCRQFPQAVFPRESLVPRHGKAAHQHQKPHAQEEFQPIVNNPNGAVADPAQVKRYTPGNMKKGNDQNPNRSVMKGRKNR